MSEKVTIEVTEMEAELLTNGLALLLQMMASDLERWSNKKDSSMEKLFMLMEVQIRTGDLWSRVQRAKGVDLETIAEHLAEADTEE